MFHIKGTCWLLHECDPVQWDLPVPRIKLIVLIVHDSSTTFTLHILNVTNCLLGSIYDCYSCFYFEVSHVYVFIRCRPTLFLVVNSTLLKSTRVFSVNRVNPIFKCCFLQTKSSLMIPNLQCTCTQVHHVLHQIKRLWWTSYIRSCRWSSLVSDLMK